MKKSILEDTGLSQNEAITYQKLLEYGEITPPKLSKITGVSRENTYYVLKSLTTKRLVEKNEKKKKITYRALHPNNLKDYVGAQREEMEKRSKTTEELIPSLVNLYSLQTSKPSISSFYGLRGIKDIYEALLKENPSPKECLVFGSSEDNSVLGTYLDQYIKRTTKAGIKEKFITHDKMGAFAINGEAKYLDHKYFDLPAEISIYNNKVSFISFKRDKIGTIIESKDLADSLRKIFNYIWDNN